MEVAESLKALGAIVLDGGLQNLLYFCALVAGVFNVGVAVLFYYF